MDYRDTDGYTTQKHYLVCHEDDTEIVQKPKYDYT